MIGWTHLKKPALNLWYRINDQAISYYDITPTKQFALVMGNEGNGVNPEILKKTDQNLYIPMNGEAESLNVAVAAGILLFKFVK